MNGKQDHTTAVCVSLRSSGDLHVVQLPAGSWHGLPRWQHGLCIRSINISAFTDAHFIYENELVYLFFVVVVVVLVRCGCYREILALIYLSVYLYVCLFPVLPFSTLV